MRTIRHRREEMIVGALFRLCITVFAKTPMCSDNNTEIVDSCIKIGEERRGKRKKREGKSGKKGESQEREGKKSLLQDSRNVVGIILTFAWMRVLYRRCVQPLSRPRFLFPRCEFGIPHGGCDCRPLARDVTHMPREERSMKKKERKRKKKKKSEPYCISVKI
ncbi:hypothetical protein PUN28_002304 [Cardiocondyla obscurior]|uniref:Secreted protein n=1 Tax=Cardiocondyla obscurior TaxID=286306 RepID=A0AAW2GTN5_9HYME